MPRYSKGDLTVETSNAREGVNLRAQGFVEHKALTAAVKAADEQADKPAPKPHK